MSDREVFNPTFLAWITTEGKGVGDYWGFMDFYCDKAWFTAFTVVVLWVLGHASRE